MKSDTTKNYFGENFWGRRWTLISIVIILVTAFFLYFSEKRKKENENKNQALEMGSTKK